MKVLLVCVGSRGDVEPFCALASELLDQGHSVEVFCQPELKELVPEGASVHTFSFTQFDFYKYAAAPSQGQDHENPRVKFIGIVTDIISSLVFPSLPDIWKVAKQECDVMLCSALARNVCFALTQQLDIPTVLLHLQPLVPTRLFPHYSDAEKSLSAILQADRQPSDDNLESYWFLERVQHEFLQKSLQELYAQLDATASAPTFEEMKIILSGNHPKIFLANAFSDGLLPSVVQDDVVGPRVRQVGALAEDYIPPNYEPDSGLEAFVQAHRPICIGFGSMPFGQVAMILQVLQQSNQKAVLVGKALDPKDIQEQAAWIADNIYHVESAPYAWLLPQCSMMVCHGGAGVTHTTLRAGIPLLISPLMGDQFFFADLVQAKGLGVRVGPHLTSMTCDELAEALEKASHCVETAREWGDKVRAQPRGVDVMMNLIQEATTSPTISP
eukprot:Nitzschia sp. Nitz4//scaffold68_size99682//20828//22153//NITZ4_004555-RA/size99682-processed-gene-0.15-mRNA-1//1//CDS//3329556566//5710//frame0